MDAAEQLRSDRIYSLCQTNRNPFVDRPEWINPTFAPAHTNPPMLNITQTPAGIALTWLATNQSTRLEFSTNLPATWRDAPVNPVHANAQFLVRWTNTLRCVFFRLRAW